MKDDHHQPVDERQRKAMPSSRAIEASELHKNKAGDTAADIARAAARGRGKPLA